ncbi:hypothetical protein LX32DRAFT_304628 [Colletotrichum zoysiae]|uniref:Uncharacterized protein n=1 Tax=Colletotrichum zoysiae TaxID=1216348 RepID=A0AAD9H2L3_9PEZI|nr:hypothetical protein LX32DRAFT_304628 [Colletotrichum zoysiae]
MSKGVCVCVRLREGEEMLRARKRWKTPPTHTQTQTDKLGKPLCAAGDMRGWRMRGGCLRGFPASQRAGWLAGFCLVLSFFLSFFQRGARPTATNEMYDVVYYYVVVSVLCTYRERERGREREALRRLD